MYSEEFTLDVLRDLEDLGAESMRRVREAVEKAMIRYDVVKREMSISPYLRDDLPPILQNYLICKKTEYLADGTLYNYRQYLSNFFRDVGKSPENISAMDIRVFLLNYQHKHQISPRSLDKIRECITTFFSWAVDNDLLSKNPARAIKPIRGEVKPREALTQLELEDLRSACETSRDRAMVELMYATGCRVSELIGLKLSDINWSDGSVHLFGKGSKHRTAYLNAKAIRAVQDYLKTRDDKCEYVIISDRKPVHGITRAAVEKRVRALREKTSITKRLTPHVLRHTMASTALQNGMALSDISVLLGHSNPGTTSIYAKTTMENVKAAYRKTVI